MLVINYTVKKNISKHWVNISKQSSMIEKM